jgi:type I restriction enzyme S subunit
MMPEDFAVSSTLQEVEALFKRQDVLEQENQHLTQLRDWLLPMLMNGQVTVK